MKHLLIWLIVSPIFLAALTHFIKKYLVKIGFLIYMIFSLANCLISLVLFWQVSVTGKIIIYRIAGWGVREGIVLAADQPALFMLLVVQILFFFSLLFSKGYLKKDHINFFVLFYLLQAGLVGMIVTSDLFNMYVFLEVVSIVSYALVAYEKTDEGIEAAFKYLVIGSLASLFIIWSIGIIYATTGHLNLAVVSGAFSSAAPIVRGVVFILFLVGFGVKFALFPFHPWLPDAHASAPSPISALLSGVVVNVQIFCLLRILLILYDLEYIISLRLNTILLILGSCSVLFGHLLALKQENIKRMLAYSSVAHIGYIVIGLSSASRQSVIGAFYHLLNHGILKAGLFFFAGTLIYYLNIKEIGQLKGLFQKNRLLSLSFCVLAIGLIGMPPMNGFLSKWLLVMGSISTGNIIPGVAIAVGGFISVIYYLRIIIPIFQPISGEEKGLRIGIFFSAPIVSTVLLSLLLFVFGNQIYGLFNQFVDQLQEHGLYLTALLNQ